MSIFLRIRKKLEDLYGRYSTIALVVLKFVFALTAFLCIRAATGYHALFSSIFVILILALLCSILPWQGTVVLSGVMIAVQSLSLGYDIGLLSCVLMLVMVLLFLRFTPEDSPAVVLQAMALYLGIPSSAAVCTGLVRSPASVVSLGSGVISYYLLRALHALPELLKNVAGNDYLERLSVFMKAIFGSSEILVNLVVLCAVSILVYAIRRQSFRRAWYWAAAVGIAVYAAGFPAACRLLGIKTDITGTLIASFLSFVIAWIFVAFVFLGDYKASEYLQFEDDDYYYYIKAVPKKSVSDTAWAKKKEALELKRRKAEELAARSEFAGSPDGEDAAAEEKPAEDAPDLLKPEVDKEELEKKLEESLKHL